MLDDRSFLNGFSNMTKSQITLCFPYIITKDTPTLLKHIRNPLKVSVLETDVEKVLNLYLTCLSEYTYWKN